MQPLQALTANLVRLGHRNAAMTLAAIGLLAVGLGTRRPITLIENQETRLVLTHARTVAGVLREAGVVLADGDISQPEVDRPARAGDRLEVRHARAVRLDVDGRRSEITSAQVVPENVLAEAGLRLYPGDRIWVDGIAHRPEGPPAVGFSRLRLVRGSRLNLVHPGGRSELTSAAPTLGEALWERGFRLRSADDVFPSAGNALAGPTGIRLTPSSPVEISADGASLRSWAAGETVGEALAHAGVALVGLDYSAPAADGPLPADGRLQVVRVLETVDVEGDAVPFVTRWEASDEIEIDHQQLVDPGETGLVARRSRVRYEDGEERRRTEEAPWLAVEPRDRIMGYGTKIVIRTLDTPGGPIEYWRAVPMYATSYSPCRLGVPNYCSITMANGEPLKHGNAAFIVRWYRVMRGQYVYVPGYGTAKISDTGGGIPGRRWIDLGYSDNDYVSWHNWVTVYFLTPVPPEGLILWVLE